MVTFKAWKMLEHVVLMVSLTITMTKTFLEAFAIMLYHCIMEYLSPIYGMARPSTYCIATCGELI